MEFSLTQSDGTRYRDTVFGTHSGGSAAGSGPRWSPLAQQLAPVFEATEQDPEAMLHAANLLAFWTAGWSAYTAPTHGTASAAPSPYVDQTPHSLAAVSALSAWPILNTSDEGIAAPFSSAFGAGDVDKLWARWSALDDNGIVVAEPDAALRSAVKAAADNHVEDLDLKMDEEHTIREPKGHRSWGRSTTPESRATNGQAQDQVARWQNKMQQARDRLASPSRGGIPTAMGGPRGAGSGGTKAQKQSLQQRQRLVQQASAALRHAKRNLRIAERNLDKTKKKTTNRDPLGAAELHGEAHPAGKKLRQKVWEHTTIKAEGSLVKTEVFKERSASLYQDDSFKERPSVLGLTVEGKTLVFGARAASNGELTVGKKGVTGNIQAQGTAALVDYQRTWDWSIAHQLLGEDMNLKLFLEVHGLLGANGVAALEVNVANLKPAKPEIDSNAIMLGVDAFAGAKVQIGVGFAYEWKKKGLAEYRPKLHSNIRALLDTAEAISRTLGFFLGQLAPTAGVEKLLGWLLEYGNEDAVPLLAVKAKGEGSWGAGACAKGAIGLRRGQLVAQVKANATWGLGAGTELELLLDVVEGPLFLLLTLGQPELLEMAYSYIRSRLKQVASVGIPAESGAPAR